tara:strand:+ start:499 stop:2271 length:1773 start_codon:yes stop_codon:yes gene_type:complete
MSIAEGYFKRGEQMREAPEQTKRIRLADVDSITTVCDLPARGLRKETLEYFGVRVELSQQDARTPVAYYFPYYDKRGKLSGYKRRDLLLDKNDRGHFTAIGNVGVACKLFGQPQAESAKGRVKAIHYQEGEFDVLSSYQAMVDALKGTKFEGKITPRVVGLSCGTANAVEATVHNEAFFDGAEKIVLGFDSDSATPLEKLKGIKRGREAMEDVAGVLMKGNLHTVTYEGDNKDPSDYLQNDQWVDLAKLLSFGTEKFVAEKVVTAGTLGFESVIEAKPSGVYVPTFPNLMEKIKGIRKRELIVLTSLSGAGKSTYVSEIAFNLALEQLAKDTGELISKGERVGMIFLEEETKETVQRMMARYLKVNYNHFKFDPQEYATKEKLMEAYEWVDGEEIDDNDLGEKEITNRFVYLDHFGSLKVDELMNKIKYLTYVCKCDYIVLDHLTLVVSGQGSGANQTAELDLVMTELAAFVAANDVGVFAISHLNRSASDVAKDIYRRMAKVESEGGDPQPEWITVSKEDMRGSSSLEALSWIVIGIDLEIMPDRTRGRTRLSVLKNRPFGLLGEADVMRMNPITGIMEDASDLAEVGI